MKTRFAIALVAMLAIGVMLERAALAETILGTGTAALLGNDLTDLGDDGNEGAYAPPDLAGFDAEFFSSDEPGFGGGEFAFNVFDNQVGGGAAKWCCGSAFPQIVGARFDKSYFMTHFTVTSSNDTPNRDPRVWQIQGSNDGNTWTDIFSQNDPNAGLWTARNQVIRWDVDVDFNTLGAFTQFRMKTDATGAVGGAFFAISEIEFFGNEIPEPSTIVLGLIGMLGLGVFGRRRRKTA